MRLRLMIVVALSCLILDAHAGGLFPRVRRRAIPERGAVINGVAFSLHNGRLYRLDHGSSAVKSVSRWPHLRKIARFRHLLAGLTYRGRLMFWHELPDRSWAPAPSPLDDLPIADFSANQNVMITISQRGTVMQWQSPHRGAILLGPSGFIGVEGYAPDVGFGLIRADQSRLYLIPDKTDCGRLLVEVPR